MSSSALSMRDGFLMSWMICCVSGLLTCAWVQAPCWEVWIVWCSCTVDKNDGREIAVLAAGAAESDETRNVVFQNRVSERSHDELGRFVGLGLGLLQEVRHSVSAVQ
jgi:hypothetical protein